MPSTNPAVVHAMSVVSGACLADCGRAVRSGTALLEAIIVGVEAAVGLGIASRAPMRFFRPATAGQMGAALALCKLNQLDRHRSLRVLGLAYSQVGGTMQAHTEGSPALAYQVGFAARNAIVALDMAQAGSHGPVDSIEGPFGYMPLIEGQWDLTVSKQRLGSVWAITELSHKPYPTGRAAHGALYMLDQMLSGQAIDVGRIERIEVAVPPLIKRLVDRPYRPQLSLSQARLCLPYLMATRLLRGPVDLNAYAGEWLRSENWLALADRVHIEDDGNPDPNALEPQALTLVMSDGQTLSRQSAATLGSPADPLDEPRQFAKFESCLDFGGIVQGPGRAAQWASLLALDEVPDVAELMATFSADVR